MIDYKVGKNITEHGILSPFCKKRNKHILTENILEGAHQVVK